MAVLLVIGGSCLAADHAMKPTRNRRDIDDQADPLPLLVVLGILVTMGLALVTRSLF